MREFVLGDLDEMYARGRRRRAWATASYLVWVIGSAAHALRDSARGGIRMDVRIAVRQFRRRPTVYVGGAVVLAVGLGIATLTWGVRYGAMGRDLPVSDPGRVLGLRLVDQRTRARSDLSVEDAEQVRRSVRSVEAIGLWTSGSANVTDETGPPEEVTVYRVSPDLLRILEITPLQGRTLVPSDDRPGAERVAVLGYRYWQERYGADPSVVGTSIRMDGDPTQIVGVLPPDKGLTAHEDVWIPAGAHGDRGARDYNALVRPAPGVASAEVASELAAVASRMSDNGQLAWQGKTLVSEGFSDSYYGGVESVRDRVLGTGGILLFVMALANVANLFLVTTRARAQELSVRRALGAGRLRILRQLVIEAAGPALLGFAGATLLATWTLRWYQAAADAYGVGFVWQVYRLEAPHVLLIAVGSLAATVFVSLAAASPELRGQRSETVRMGRGTVSGRFPLGRALLGIEVSVGAALLLVASLMVRSGWNLRSVDFGFTTESVMTGDVTLRGTDYAEPEARVAFWGRLQERLAALPGVQEATVGAQLPMIRCCNNAFRIELEGWAAAEPDALPVHYVNGVGPTYFDTFEKPIVTGRGLTTGDHATSDPVVLVNVHFAERYYPQEVPVGRRLRLWRGDEPGPWRTVVGVAPHLWMDTDVNANPEGLYVPLAQLAPSRASFAIRVSGVTEVYADELRATVMGLDPDLPVNDLRSMPQLFRDRTRLYRREGPLFTFLGIAALALAIAGVYAVVSYMAALRTAELGLRSVLGANRAEIIRRSVGGATLPTALGAGVGLGLGLLLTRGFDRFVFLVDPWSPRVAVGTVLILMASAVAASLMPALRAGRIDPAEVLRSE
jgi:putative ABC transport system permease protein